MQHCVSISIDIKDWVQEAGCLIIIEAVEVASSTQW